MPMLLILLSPFALASRARPGPLKHASHDQRDPRERERGSVAAQVVIAMVLLVFVVIAIVQVALAAYANHIAQGAADQALDAARTLGASSADGQTEAQDVLAQLATGPLVNAHVSVTRTATTVTVTITGHAERVWLGPVLPVHASATGVIEQFSAAP
jgi:Flp pilus assembly protein TadG